MNEKITNLQDLKAYLENNRKVAFKFKTAPKYQHRGEAHADIDPTKSYIVGCSFSVSERCI